MINLVTAREALELFKSNVTLKQMEGKIAPKIYQLLLQEQGAGSDLILVIPNPRLNKQVTTLIQHWVPTALDEGFISLLGLIPTPIGWRKPAEPPTTQQMVDTITKTVKKITDTHKPA